MIFLCPFAKKRTRKSRSSSVGDLKSLLSLVAANRVGNALWFVNNQIKQIDDPRDVVFSTTGISPIYLFFIFFFSIFNHLERQQQQVERKEKLRVERLGLLIKLIDQEKRSIETSALIDWWNQGRKKKLNKKTSWIFCCPGLEKRVCQSPGIIRMISFQLPRAHYFICNFSLSLSLS